MTEKVFRIVLTPYPRCYVYVHFHPQKAKRGEWEVVYVGKGTRGRAWDDTRRCPDHRRWLRDWQNLGFSPDEFVKIVSRKLTSKEAARQERKAIAFHRKKGDLLFNKCRSKKWPVRTYENKHTPNPKFGKLG